MADAETTMNRLRCSRRLTVYCGELFACLLLVLTTGCWAPLKSRGVPATQLPDIYRMPMRTGGLPLNFSKLTINPPEDYLLGAGDKLDVTVAELQEGAEIKPIPVQVMANGTIQLPLIGSIDIGGMNLVEAHEQIEKAYADGYLKNPRVNVTLVEEATTPVLVLGEVNIPGVHILPKYQNDVGHAIAAAGGLGENAADEIEVHRRSGTASIPSGMLGSRYPAMTGQECLLEAPLTVPECWDHLMPENSGAVYEDSSAIFTIPLRTPPGFQLNEEQIRLGSGDVVVVPSRKNEVFYVVGKLNEANTVRFTIGDRERELGVGFVLPREREIDVVTAVVMAGYIDPIDSPTTVTVHRIRPDGRPMLIRVDLIEARYNPRATVLVEPGDIIYLNPDAQWYTRRVLDRIIPEILTTPYNFFIRRSIIGRGQF